jgi:hypothetical protein
LRQNQVRVHELNHCFNVCELVSIICFAFSARRR